MTHLVTVQSDLIRALWDTQQAEQTRIATEVEELKASLDPNPNRKRKKQKREGEGEAGGKGSWTGRFIRRIAPRREVTGWEVPHAAVLEAACKPVAEAIRKLLW